MQKNQIGLRTIPFQFSSGGNFNSSLKLVYPVVLLRGLGRSSGFWLDFPNFLANYSNVYLLDLPGTGLSKGRLGRGSIEALAGDIITALKEHSLGNCHLLGISLGGMVALEVANKVPTLKSLSILSSSARFTGEERISKQALFKMLGALKNLPPKNKSFAPYLVSENFLQNNPQLIPQWDELWQQEGFQPIAVLRQLLAAAFFNNKNILQSLHLPTFFSVSEGDKLVSWRNTPRLWELVKGAEMYVLPEGGHDFPTEYPAQIAAILSKFWHRAENISNI